MKKLFFLILTLCLFACGHKPVDAPKPAAADTDNIEPTKAAHVLFHGDVEFTADEREKILLAAEMWRIQTSGLAQIEVVWDLDFGDQEDIELHKLAGSNMLARFMSWDALVVEHDLKGEGNLLGQVSPSGGIHNPWRAPLRMLLVVDRLENDGELMTVALHEFGHTLGVPHVSSVQGVMFPMYIRQPHVCLKKADLTAFCGVNECGTVKLHPCE